MRRRAPARRCAAALTAASTSATDWSVAGRYLQDCRAGYTLCEDTVGGTLDPDQHLLVAQRAAADFAARRRGKGLPVLGHSRFCRAVESEDAAKCTLFPPEKLVTFSKKRCWKA